MATFLLVPGAWLGGWAWSRVAPRLRAAGHEVHLQTLTGLGDRAHLDVGEIDLETHVRDILATIEAEELSDLVLVGHSYAGAPVTGAAERAPERIARLVYVAGVVPRDGLTLLDELPPGADEVIEAIVAERGGGRVIPPLDDEQRILYYGPDHGLAPEDLAWLRAHEAGHPIDTHRQGLSLGDPAAAALPRTYVRCTSDIFPAPVQPGTPGWDFAELPTGHWPMVTMPAELAELLDRAARA